MEGQSMGKVNAPQGFEPKFIRHWYMVANRTEALVYEGNLRQGFRFVKRYRNPKGRLLERDLEGDRPGRSFSSARGSSIRHGLEPHSHRHETVAIQFARYLARTLDEAVLKSSLTDLVVMAEPHFLGLLNQHFSKRVKSVISRQVPNEWAQGSDEELKAYIQRKLA
jgi:protein required for attachment to host cells